MTFRQRLALGLVSWVAWAGLYLILSNWPWVLWVQIGISAVVYGPLLGFFIAGMWPFQRFVERKPDGVNRQTEESDRDPATSGASGTFTAPASGKYAVNLSFNIASPDPRESALEHVSEDMPILAHRAALLLPALGGPEFSSLYGGRFGVDAVAECSSAVWSMRGYHSAPDVRCHCGFYAVPIAERLSSYVGCIWYLDVLVELSGRVIEHETGYRAQHQRVIEARVPGCDRCSAPAAGLRLGDDGIESICCQKHRPHQAISDGRWLDREDLERGLPVPVSYMDAWA